MEMTKWFDTNYHYLVPELGPEVEFRLAATPKPLVELAEARELGIATRPVLLGPVTFLLLGKAADGTSAGFDRLSLLDPLLEVYGELLDELAAAGAEWVQLDEPAFVQDRSPAELDALARAYDRLGRSSARPRLLVSSYFDHLGDALGVLAGAPVDGIGLDLTRDGARNLERWPPPAASAAGPGRRGGRRRSV
jgi:5-methyltetrahydropteroyltriglutamate--homocysteine methyltransferase